MEIDSCYYESHRSWCIPQFPSADWRSRRESWWGNSSFMPTAWESKTPVPEGTRGQISRSRDIHYHFCPTRLPMTGMLRTCVGEGSFSLPDLKIQVLTSSRHTQKECSTPNLVQLTHEISHHRKLHFNLNAHSSRFDPFFSRFLSSRPHPVVMPWGLEPGAQPTSLIRDSDTWTLTSAIGGRLEPGSKLRLSEVGHGCLNQYLNYWTSLKDWFVIFKEVIDSKGRVTERRWIFPVCSRGPNTWAVSLPCFAH